MSSKISAAMVSVEENIANLESTTKQIVLDAEKIVDNVLLGDCPIEIDKVFVFVQNADDISAKNSIKILCNYTNPVVETSDALLLERLCTMNGSFNLSMGEDLKEIRESGQYVSLEAAVPALVALAVKMGWASDVNDEERLRMKFSVWLKGVQWTDCDDAVLEKGKKLPWDYHGYLYTKALYDGVIGLNIVVMFENDHPVDIVGADHADLFQELWCRKNGACESVEQSVIQAIALSLDFNSQVKARVSRSEKSLNRRSSKKKSKQRSWWSRFGCTC